MATLHKIPLYILLSYIITTKKLLAQRDNYIVHMDFSVMPKAFTSHYSWYLATLESALLSSKTKISRTTTTTTTTTTTDSRDKLLYSYTHVINGFSASLTPDELESLKSSTGYVSSIKDLPVKYDTTHSTEFLGLSSTSGVWKTTNYGEGIIIGMVDTGVWPESESYNDDGMPDIPKRWKGACESGTLFNSSMCNKKLIGARYFNKALVAKTNVTIAMNSCRDTDGHGTHTSSTAAGNFVDGASYFGYAPGTARGVAPRAHVSAYKVLWDEGAYASDIIAGIDQAIMDGVDVISLSLGIDGLALYEDPLALATFAAIDKNIFVSTSAGNQGPFPETLHNGTPWVLTVAAGTIDRDFGAVLKLGQDISVTGATLYPGDFSPGKTFPVVFKDTCLNFKELQKLVNKIVVCEDKNESISDQVDNLSRSNVTAAVFITNITDLEFFIQTSFPAVFITPKDGESIKGYIKSNKAPVASLEFKKTILGTKLAPRVTSYSSRGPSASCPFVLKPDIMAPGSLILAAWPDKTTIGFINSQPVYSKFNLLSGTSMSCPHAAGVAALVKQAHPEWSPAAIRSAMMTTADTMDHTMEPIKDIGDSNQVASPFAIGSGQVNPNQAINPGLVYDITSKDYVNLLCALNYTEKQIKTITGTSSIDCSHPSSDLNYPSFIAFFNINDTKSKTIQEFYRTVTNVGDEPSTTYTASITPMNEVKVTVVPNKLQFKSKNQKLSYKLVIEGPKLLNETIVFGYLSWVDSKSKYVVKSPIVATSLSSNAISSLEGN